MRLGTFQSWRKFARACSAHLFSRSETQRSVLAVATHTSRYRQDTQHGTELARQALDSCSNPMATWPSLPSTTSTAVHPHHFCPKNLNNWRHTAQVPVTPHLQAKAQASLAQHGNLHSLASALCLLSHHSLHDKPSRSSIHLCLSALCLYYLLAVFPKPSHIWIIFKFLCFAYISVTELNRGE